jgi:hypothetical protein
MEKREGDREVCDRAGLRRGRSVKHEIGEEVRMRIREDNLVIELVHHRLVSQREERSGDRARDDKTFFMVSCCPPPG